MGIVNLLNVNSTQTEIKADMASVNLESVSGKLSVRIDMGSLTGRDISSDDVNVKADGEVELTGLKGALRIEGGPCSAKLRWAEAPASGEINISARGDVAMYFPETSKLTPQLSTSGKIINDFATTADGIPLSVNARGGDISIHKYNNSKIKAIAK